MPAILSPPQYVNYFNDDQISRPSYWYKYMIYTIGTPLPFIYASVLVLIIKENTRNTQQLEW